MTFLAQGTAVINAGKVVSSSWYDICPPREQLTDEELRDFLLSDKDVENQLLKLPDGQYNFHSGSEKAVVFYNREVQEGDLV